ncbi:MAG: hypothetical protein JW940_10045 [Polyangiaceae bacterium]|nr:hypothetical protein [Polyangiaceae bacterium]
MGLDELNRSVTSAILRAEGLVPGSWEAERAFRYVAELEEEISAVAGANTVQGEVARLGAVTASMSAGDLVRAVQLAERYLADALSDRSRAKLKELQDEAEAEMARAALSGPNVEPVMFTLRAA